MALHPAAKPKIVPAIGVGLVATQEIPEGTIIWHPEPGDLLVKCHEICGLPRPTYTWLDELGYRLDNGDLILPSNGACFFNHSCNPNVTDYGMDFGVAVRRVDIGEQLLIDYGTFAHDKKFRFKCKCGEPACRVLVTNDPAKVVHQPIPVEAVAKILSVSQPLHISLKRTSWTYNQLLAGRRADMLQMTSVCSPPRIFEHLAYPADTCD